MKHSKNLKTEFYINDAGSQIKKFNDSVNALRLNKEIPEDGYHGHYVTELAKTKNNPVEEILKQQKDTLNKINVTFDNWFSETSLHQNDAIKNILKKLEKIELVYTKDDATWFKSTEFGDEKDRVLIKSDGSYTYFLVDIAYHHNKIKRGFTDLIAILGADHHGYINRLKAAIKALGKVESTSVNLDVVLGQLVNLFRDGEAVRMSKRTGEMITLAEVIDEIGVDATRYYLIEKSHDTTIDFDLELAKKKSSENPVYYIQYAHARMNSILNKINITVNKDTIKTNSLERAERDLIVLTNNIHNVIQEATNKLSPYKLAYYLTQLARSFHYFYETCPIMKSEKDIKKKEL